MEHQKDGQEAVENVISGKHFDDLRSLNGCAVQDPRGVDAQTGYNPGQSKAGK